MGLQERTSMEADGRCQVITVFCKKKRTTDEVTTQTTASPRLYTCCGASWRGLTVSNGSDAIYSYKLTLTN